MKIIRDSGWHIVRSYETHGLANYKREVEIEDGDTRDLMNIYYSLENPGNTPIKPNGFSENGNRHTITFVTTFDPSI